MSGWTPSPFDHRRPGGYPQHPFESWQGNGPHRAGDGGLGLYGSDSYEGRHRRKPSARPTTSSWHCRRPGGNAKATPAG